MARPRWNADCPMSTRVIFVCQPSLPPNCYGLPLLVRLDNWVKIIIYWPQLDSRLFKTTFKNSSISRPWIWSNQIQGFSRLSRSRTDPVLWQAPVPVICPTWRRRCEAGVLSGPPPLWRSDLSCCTPGNIQFTSFKCNCLILTAILSVPLNTLSERYFKNVCIIFIHIKKPYFLN